MPQGHEGNGPLNLMILSTVRCNDKMFIIISYLHTLANTTLHWTLCHQRDILVAGEWVINIVQCNW